ncbi:MAG: ATP-binding protein [Nodosilinea sp.]
MTPKAPSYSATELVSSPHASALPKDILPPSLATKPSLDAASDWLAEAETCSSQSLAHLAEVGRQTARLAHEIRSPLSVILNVLWLCQRMPLPEIARQRLTLALEEAERINRMMDEVLAFARHARYPEFQWQRLELNGLIDETIRLVAQTPIAQGCQLEAPPDMPTVWVQGDRDKLKQVLINLLTNACEALGGHGRVSCQLILSHQNTCGLIKICNSPPPQDSAALPRCRQHPKAHQGLGLGLGLVRQLVQSHGGKFWLESSPLGATATVQLPLRPLPGRQAAHAASQSQSVIVYNSI